MGFFDFFKRTPEFQSEVVTEVTKSQNDVEKSAGSFNSGIASSSASAINLALKPDKILDETAAACIELIGDNTSANTLYVERKQTDGKWVRDESPFGLAQTIGMPGPRTAQPEFISMIAQALQIYGVAYIVKSSTLRDYLEVVKEGPFCTMTKDQFGDLKELYFKGEDIDLDNVIIVKKPTILNAPASPYQIAMSGMEALAVARKAIEAADNERGVMTGIITPKGPRMSPEQFKGFFDDVTKVKRDKKGWLVSNNAIDFTALGGGTSTSVDSLSAHEDRIALAFRTPPTLLGRLENATYSNVQTTKIFFFDFVIRPIQRLIEAAFTMDAGDPSVRYRFDITKTDALIVNFTNRLAAAKNSPAGIPFDQIIEQLLPEFTSFSGSDYSFMPSNLIPAHELSGEDLAPDVQDEEE